LDHLVEESQSTQIQRIESIIEDSVNRNSNNDNMMLEDSEEVNFHQQQPDDSEATQLEPTQLDN